MHDHAGTVIGGSDERSGPHAPRAISPAIVGNSSRISSNTIFGGTQSRPTIITLRAAIRGSLVGRSRLARATRRPSVTDHSFIFVGGMHRSGTSMLARLLAQHPAVSGFSGTGVPEDEGQHLQTVYPMPSPGRQAGRFAFVPDAHRTERSPLVTPENRERLFAEWSHHWDISRPYLLEKSPVNLMTTRFLQALFPRSYHLVIVRHPVAVACATQKWSDTRPDSLIRHWLRGYECFLADMPHLQRAYVVRYERLVEAPDEQLERILGFLELDRAGLTTKLRPGVNDHYFGRWDMRRRNPAKRAYLDLVARRYESRVARFGYSLRDYRRPAVAVPDIPGLS